MITDIHSHLVTDMHEHKINSFSMKDKDTDGFISAKHISIGIHPWYVTADDIEQQTEWINQPDLTRCGGFLVMKEVEQIALDNGCELVPHGFSTQILLHATTQFLAFSKTCNLIEYSKSTSPLFNICNALSCEDGIVKIDDCIGLGITLNEEIIKKYEVK